MAQVRFTSIPHQDDSEGACASHSGVHDDSTHDLPALSALLPEHPPSTIPQQCQNDTIENLNAESANENLLSKMLKLTEDGSSIADGTADLPGDLQNVEDWFKSKSDSMSSLDFDTDLKNSEIDIGDLFNLKGGLQFHIGSSDTLGGGGQSLLKESYGASTSTAGASDECTQGADKGIFEEMLLTDSLQKMCKFKTESQLTNALDIDKSSLEEMLLPGIHEILSTSSIADRKEILQALQLGALQQETPLGVLPTLDLESSQPLQSAEDLDQLMGSTNLQPLKVESMVQRSLGFEDAVGKDTRWIKNLLSSKTMDDLNFEGLAAHDLQQHEHETSNMQTEFLATSGTNNNEIDCKLSSILALNAADDAMGSANPDLLDTIDKNFLKSDLGITPDISQLKDISTDTSSKQSVQSTISKSNLNSNLVFSSNVLENKKSESNSFNDQKSTDVQSIIENIPSFSSDSPNFAFSSIPAPDSQSNLPTSSCSSTAVPSLNIEPGFYQVLSNITGNVLSGLSYQLIYDENNSPILTPCNVASIPAASPVTDGSFITSTKSTQIKTNAATPTINAVNPLLKLIQKQNIQKSTASITINNSSPKSSIASASIPMLQPSLVFGSVKPSNKLVKVSENILQALQDSYKTSPKNIKSKPLKRMSSSIPVDVGVAAKVVKLAKGTQVKALSNLPKISINKPASNLDSSSKLFGSAVTSVAESSTKKHDGQATVLMSLDLRANLTSVSVISSNHEQTVFKINSSDLVRAVSSIKDFHLDPLGLVPSQLIQRAITANKFIKGIQKKNSFLKNGNDSGKVSSNQKFEINQVLPEFKPPVSRNKTPSNAKLTSAAIPAAVPSSNLLTREASNTVNVRPPSTVPTPVKPTSQFGSIQQQQQPPATSTAPLQRGQLTTVAAANTASSLRLPSSVGVGKRSLTAVLSGGTPRSVTVLPRIVTVLPRKAAGSSQFSIAADKSHTVQLQQPNKITLKKTANERALTRLSKPSEAEESESSSSDQHDFISTRKSMPSGVGVSLLPGAPPTMVSVPSVLDSLSPIMSNSFPSSSALLSSYSSSALKVSCSSALKVSSSSSVKVMTSSTSSGARSVHQKAVPCLASSSSSGGGSKMVVTAGSPLTASNSTGPSAAAAEVNVSKATTDGDGAWQLTSSQSATEAVNKGDSREEFRKQEEEEEEEDEEQVDDVEEEEKEEGEAGVRDSKTSSTAQEEVEGLPEDSANGKLEAVLSRALESVGVSVAAVLAAQPSSAPHQWLCVHPGCNTTCSKLSLLKVHILSHYYVRPYRCTYEGCDWAFASSFKLKRHLETHLNRRDFVCEEPNCGRRFSTIYNLRSHRRMHQLPYQWRCDTQGCSETFRTKRLYQSHQRLHSDAQAPYKCTVEGCSKSYFSASALTFHVRNHSRDHSELRCQWPNCGKQYDKPCRLKAHMRVHTGQRPFVCDFEGCKWSFKSSSKLTRHKRKHTNCRNFVCPICQKSFLRSEHLKGHLLLHTGVRNFHCTHEGCNAKFTAKSSLYVHLKKHVRQEAAAAAAAVVAAAAAPSAPTSFPCPIDSCSKSYSSKSCLRQHLLSNHTPILAPNSRHLDYITLVGERGDLAASDPPLLPPLLSTTTTTTTTTASINNITSTSNTGGTSSTDAGAGISNNRECSVAGYNGNVSSHSSGPLEGCSSQALVSHQMGGGGCSMAGGGGATGGVILDASSVSLLRSFELLGSGFGTGSEGQGLESEHEMGGDDPSHHLTASLMQQSTEGLSPVCGGEDLYPPDALMGHDLLTDTTAPLHAAQTTINLRDLD